MVDEAANLPVQRDNRFDIFKAQFKIENVEILNDSISMNGFWNNNHSPLYQPKWAFRRDYSIRPSACFLAFHSTHDAAWYSSSLTFSIQSAALPWSCS